MCAAGWVARSPGCLMTSTRRQAAQFTGWARRRWDCPRRTSTVCRPWAAVDAAHLTRHPGALLLARSALCRRCGVGAAAAAVGDRTADRPGGSQLAWVGCGRCPVLLSRDPTSRCPSLGEWGCWEGVWWVICDQPRCLEVERPALYPAGVVLHAPAVECERATPA